MNVTPAHRLQFLHHPHASALFERTAWDLPIAMVFGDSGSGKSDILTGVFNEVETLHPASSLLIQCGSDWNLTQFTKEVTTAITDAGLQNTSYLPPAWQKQSLVKQLRLFGVRHLFLDNLHKLRSQTIDHVATIAHTTNSPAKPSLRVMASTTEAPDNLEGRVPQFRGCYCGPLVLTPLCWKAVGELLGETTNSFCGLIKLAVVTEPTGSSLLAKTMLQYVHQVTGGNLGKVDRFGRAFAQRFGIEQATMEQVKTVAAEFDSALVARYEENDLLHVPSGKAVALAYS
jgi:hypothetical protein